MITLRRALYTDASEASLSALLPNPAVTPSIILHHGQPFALRLITPVDDAARPMDPGLQSTAQLAASVLAIMAQPTFDAYDTEVLAEAARRWVAAHPFCLET